MTTDTISKIVTTFVVVLVVSFLQKIINTKRGHRGRQAVLLVFSVVFCAVGTSILLKYYDKLAFPTEPETFFSYVDIALINIILMAGFIMAKCILCPVISMVWKKQRFMELTSSSFYEFDDDYSEWFLMKKWVDFRQVCKWLSIGLALTCAGFLATTWIVGSSSPLWLYYFPCSILVIVSELWHFINGYTKEEFQHDILGDDSDSRRVGNFYRVREIYEKLFAPQVLASHTGCEFSGKFGATELLKRLEESDNETDKDIANYFNSCDEDVFPDVDYIQGTAQLMYRKSVVFFNPFYRDLGLYITFPIINTLLSGKKCLVITGRSSTCSDVKKWMAALLKKYCRMNTLWRVADLTTHFPECEVGVLCFQQLYDLRMLKANREFFNETDFVFIIEPSIIVNTGQIGLNIIASEIGGRDRKPVYCISDRKTDGLVDTLSHLLGVEITNVQASPVPRCMYTSMSWNADGDFVRQRLFDKQTKYLGNGIELAAVAIKNQVPKVSWYSETKSPVRDIKWITGQYYATICRYMNLPAQQQNIYDKINFISNLWGAPESKEEFIIAEDEFCNMFSSMRAYLSRGSEQAFINVLSENYLLRDYMRCNRQMFTSDPNAIPSIVPDYAKTERNVFLRLILLMSYRYVMETEVIDELSLIGYHTDSALSALADLQSKYTYIDDSIFMVQSINKDDEDFNSFTLDAFCVSSENFSKYFADSLKNAYFVVEDEKRKFDFIDGKLFGHVTQTILPGQFITYDGKYYVARHVSPTSGVVLRRASDLYSGRKYYRQIRTYRITTPDKNETMSIRTVMDIEIAFISYSFDVLTTGYLEMKDNHDLRTARVIDFAEDPSVDNYVRSYKNKTLLRIKFPDTNDKLRFTICMLLSEVFRSIFPNSWQYISVITKRPDDIAGMLNHVVHQVEGELEDGYIYIIEDSDIDLGLLEAIDRNLMQIMEIVTDFLDWHFEKMREPESKDPVPSPVTLPKDEKIKRNMVVKMFERIRKIFGSKREDEFRIPKIPESVFVPTSQNDSPTEEVTFAPVERAEYSLDESFSEEQSLENIPELDNEAGGEFYEYSLDNETGNAVDMSNEERISHIEHVKETNKKVNEVKNDVFLPSDDDGVDIVHIDGTDIFDNEGIPEENAELELSLIAAGITPITKTRYQQECYLKFGFEEIDSRIQVEDVRKYLRVRGFSNGSLAKARKRDILEKQLLDFDAVNHCDFCNSPLTGVSYEKMNDGRIRCNNCSGSAIVTVDEFRDLFHRVLDMMECFYSLAFKVPISVKVTDAHTIAKGTGCVFRPSEQYADRVLGYAQQIHGRYSLFIENGSPYLAAMDLVVHELTHIWQFINWSDKEIQKHYGNGRNREMIYEGMAMWAAIQFLYQIGETAYAELQESIVELRNDIYGEGLRIYREKYPFVKDSSLIKFTPFSMFPPL